MPSWLCGVALSTTSVAVVYTVMLELGFNVTEYGKAIAAACFINDLGTVIPLELIFSPFTIKTLKFVMASIVVFMVLPFLTPRFSRSMADASQSRKPRTFCSSFSPLAEWPSGLEAKRCCRLT
jgi:Kef-type K+ transport system membrane component KefB